ncbi:hypothetical protein Psed_5108 [Pseudonocardia dioxanivorans CB1190]|uniref:Uncharacterized protein n=1 Tax=Pseudonocardia dioxanivorans (strain ATCC 55486 / DSM 44775 / JCM 13855 / CB1190) TaxID=675635 RepID=F4CQ49_PSEUX|nr:hypothetical protein Psed_5108 [Pseudonocardia dioxanivorans CB1190]
MSLVRRSPERGTAPGGLVSERAVRSGDRRSGDSRGVVGERRGPGHPAALGSARETLDPVNGRFDARSGAILPDFGQDSGVSDVGRARSGSVPAGELDAHRELVEHLVRSTPLSEGEAGRVVAEVLGYFGESTEHFVRRRHGELQRRGMTNDRIFERVGAELAVRRVVPPALSARQLRRIVYG